MAVIYVCDGCGLQRPADKAAYGESCKPSEWYIRGDSDGDQHACSFKCAKIVAAATGKIAVVVPC